MRAAQRWAFVAVLWLTPGFARAQTVKSYGDFGAWSVTLATDPRGDEYCLLSTRDPPAGPSQNLSFAVDSNYTRIFLGYEGPPAPTPSTLQLATDGAAIVRLKIVYPQSDFSGGVHLIVVELPPNMLDYLILPSLTGGRALTVSAGRIFFTVPITGFAAITGPLDACARQERADDANLK